MREDLTIATISLSSGADLKQNLATALEAVEKAAKRGADWVLLPEVFTYIGENSRIFDHADPVRGPIYESLAKKASDLNICLFAGSYAERIDGGPNTDSKVHNVSYVFDRSGNEQARYVKTHLFNLFDKGRPIYCESDTYQAGHSLESLILEGWKVGLSICYDLRFPQLYQALAASSPLDIITVPAAFTLETGKDHWEVLLRARAIELQAYVIAANQFGSKAGSKRNYGHSMIIDPWGYKLADTGDQYGIALAEISKKRISEIRKKLPALKDAKDSLYKKYL
jgi:predicted amidohydrolase